MQPKSLNTSKRKRGKNKWQIGFNLDALLNFGIVELEIPTEHKQNIPAQKKKQNIIVGSGESECKNTAI